MNPTIKKIFYIIAIIVLTVVLTKTCSKPETILVPRDIYRTKIVELNKQADSTQLAANKQDSVVTKVITRWRTKTKDSLIYKECEELILICDTIIKIDSTEKASLRHLNNLQDSIIGNQKKIIQQDSCEIVGLKKDKRKLKTKNGLLLGGLIITSGAAVLK